MFFSVHALFLDVFGTAIHNSFCFWRIPPIRSLKILFRGSPLAEGNCRQTSGSDTGKPRTMEQLTLAGKTARYQMLSISIPHYSNSLTQRPEILGDFGMLSLYFLLLSTSKSCRKKTPNSSWFPCWFSCIMTDPQCIIWEFLMRIDSKSTELEMSIHNTWARMKSYPGETSLNAPPEK